MAIEGNFFKVTKVTSYLKNKRLNKAGFTQYEKISRFFQTRNFAKIGTKKYIFQRAFTG